MIEQAVRIGTFAGIPVRIHWTFLLIIIYFVSVGISKGHSLQMIVVEICYVLAIFVCVVLHEFGHALTAKRYQIKTEDIILLPIGGVARLRNMPAKPIQELWVALMGPAVNLFIFIFIFTLLTSLFGWSYWSEFFSQESIEMSWSDFPVLLMITNLGLLLFNMIPAFPMDGGRVLRALLAMWMGRLVATKWATRVGQIICILMIGIGIYYNAWTMALIGFFIFFSAGQEYRAVSMDEMLKDKTLGMCARRLSEPLLEYQTIREAITDVIQSGQSSFLVMNLEGQMAGFVSSSAIAKMIKTNPELRIKDIMSKDIRVLHPNTSIHAVIQYFRNNQPFVLLSSETENYHYYCDPEVLDQYLRIKQN